MNKRRHYLRLSFLKILLSIIIVSCVCGCMFFRQPKRQDGNTSFNEFKKQDTAALDEAPKLLIADYRDMKEDDLISWVWIKPGFELRLCRSFEIAPVINSSPFSYPWAEEKIFQWLKKIFNSTVIKGGGTIDAEVKSAIVDMRPRKKLTSRLLPFEEDFVYIEMQLVILDRSTQEILCKLIHGKRTEDFKTSVDGMMKDVEQYFLKGMPRKQ
jgi:hypothetical protein